MSICHAKKTINGKICCKNAWMVWVLSACDMLAILCVWVAVTLRHTCHFGESRTKCWSLWWRSPNHSVHQPLFDNWRKLCVAVCLLQECFAGGHLSFPLSILLINLTTDVVGSKPSCKPLADETRQTCQEAPESFTPVKPFTAFYVKVM